MYVYLHIPNHQKNQIMENTTQNKFEIGSEVVRSKGDYVVGRVGRVIALDTEKNRAQVEWYTASNSWVKCECLELTSIPYEIVIGKGMCRKTGRIEWDTYRRLA